MSGKVKHYLACANTAKGFRNYFESNLQGLNKIFILKGGPGTGKSTLMRKIGSYYNSLGYDIEHIHCSSDLASLDGVVIRTLGVAIVDGTAPHVIEPTAPGALEEYVHLGTAWDIDLLEKSKDKILEIQSELRTCYQKAYACMGKALQIHDEWEKIYINHMDFEKANEFTKETINRILAQPTEPAKQKGREVHRFFGASTPKGPMNFIDTITASYRTRYFILGRPGTGKSTLLKKILAKILESGKDVEVYHCALDPDSLDMLCVPSLGLCIFDSTSPHEYAPSNVGDRILDMYKECVEPGTDEKYETELHQIAIHYKEIMKEANSHLGMAKTLHDQLETYYVKATDFDVINAIREQLVRRIEKYKK